MSRSLPERPHVAQLRRQAKELHRAAAAGDPEALRRLHAVSERISLATAHLALAREYGAPSWLRLKEEVERRRLAGPIAWGEVSPSPAWPEVRTEGPPPTPWTMPPQPWSERVMGKRQVALGPEVVAHGTVDGRTFGVCAYEVEPAPDATIEEEEGGSRRGLWMAFEGEGMGGGGAGAGSMEVPEGLHMVVTGNISEDPPVLAWYGTVAEDVAAVQARLGDGRTQDVALRRVWTEVPRMFVCFAPQGADTHLVALDGSGEMLERLDLPNATLGGGGGGVTFLREQP